MEFAKLNICLTERAVGDTRQDGMLPVVLQWDGFKVLSFLHPSTVSADYTEAKDLIKEAQELAQVSKVEIHQYIDNFNISYCNSNRIRINCRIFSVDHHENMEWPCNGSVAITNTLLNTSCSPLAFPLSQKVEI